MRRIERIISSFMEVLNFNLIMISQKDVMKDISISYGLWVYKGGSI